MIKQDVEQHRDVLTQLHPSCTDAESSANTTTYHTKEETKPISPSALRQCKAQYELQSEDADDEQAFAIWCFMKQAHGIRLLLQGVWSEVSRGELTIRVASLVTHEAFAILFYASTSLSNQFPNLAVFDDLAAALEISVDTNETKIENLAFKDAAHGPNDYHKGIEAAQLLCIPAFSVLALLREFYVNQNIDLDRAFDAMHHAEATHPLATVVLSNFEQLRLLILDEERLADFAQGDMFSFDLLRFIAYTDLQLHFVIMFQIYMDILDRLDDNQSLHCVQLRYIKERVERSPHEFERVWPTLKDANLYNKHLHDRSSRNQFMRIIEQGLGRVLIAQDNEHIPKDGSPDTGRFFLPGIVVDFPVLAGRIGGVIADLKHDDGVSACSGVVIMAVAHIYTACRGAGMLERKWDDMEFIIERHGRKSFGLREVSTGSMTLLSAAKQYGLAMGLQLRQYGRDRSKPVYAQRVPLPSHKSIVGRGIGKLFPRSAYGTARREFLDGKDCMGVSSRHNQQKILYQLAKQILAEPREGVDPALPISGCLVKSLRPRSFCLCSRHRSLLTRSASILTTTALFSTVGECSI